MNNLLSCRYNMDTNRVEARFEDGTTVAIDCIAIEDEYGNTQFVEQELCYLTSGVSYLFLIQGSFPSVFLRCRATARMNDPPPGVRRLASCPGGGFLSCSGLFDNGYGSMMLKVFSNFEV